MKKKKSFISLVLAFCLIVPAMFMLFACGRLDNTGLAKIEFTDSMTKEEIISMLGKVENFAVEDHDEYYGGKFWKHVYTVDGFYMTRHSEETGEFDGTYSFYFIEDNRAYDFIYCDDNKPENDRVIITDLIGYEIENSYGAKQEIEYIIDNINKGDYTIENGNIKTVMRDGSEIIYKNFNTTTIPEIPARYKDYKTMKTNRYAVKYELGSDDTYSVEYISEYIKSCEIPETYNGKQVTEFRGSYFSESSLQTLTLPTSIKKLGDYLSVGDSGLHVIYKGTKAQWKEIENSDIWSKESDVRITCIDGDYVA